MGDKWYPHVTAWHGMLQATSNIQLLCLSLCSNAPMFQAMSKQIAKRERGKYAATSAIMLTSTTLSSQTELITKSLYGGSNISTMAINTQ